MPKRQRKDESEDEKKDIKKFRLASIVYNFFHDKPESAKQESPSVLVCNGERYNVFPQILETCSSLFSQRWEHVKQGKQNFVNLDDLEIRGVQVYADWAMDHTEPVLIAANNNDGDIFDDIIVCYLTARSLRAYLLCDLIIHEACEIGKDTDLVVRHDQITKVYAETKRSDDSLRLLLATQVAYQRRNCLINPITGRDPKPEKQRLRFEALPMDFQFDLMRELSKNTAGQNPCYKPRRFFKVVDYHMEKRERQRLENERKRLEQQGGRDSSPLFVGEEEDDV
ncbi:hypothetical protein E4T42_09512 [Aureobasidium subglaciale]|nr:hypothetical protein E4T42_09512 [Aureobasidium subglaciale]